MREIVEKRCPMCSLTKKATEFYKNKRDGLSPYCKPCSAIRKRKGDKTKQQITDEAYPTDKTKICSKCKKEKLRTEFNTRVRNGKPELRTYCRDCQKDQYKTWAMRTGKQKHQSRKEKLENIRKKRYPEENKKLCSYCNTVKDKSEFGSRYRGGECKECRSKLQSEHYKIKKEFYKDKRRIYRQSNLAKVREYARNGYKRRRAAKAGVVATLTTNEWLSIMSKYENKCLSCGSTENMSIDHIIPISKGGNHTVDNVQPLCMRCNSSKHTKIIDYRKIT